MHLKRLTAASKYLVLPAALLIVTGWLLHTPAGLLGKADAVGYSVCHRISERSFHINERPLPLCARCSGMYLGALVCLTYQAATGRKRSGMPGWRILIPLAVLATAFSVDGANSYLYLLKNNMHILEHIPNLYQPSNLLRLLTGSGMGVAMAAVIYPSFNATVWSDADEHPALSGLGSLGILLGITLLLDLLVLTDSPLVLYPLAFISTAGVLVLLSMIYSLVWIMLTRQENSFTRFSQMWLVLIAGLTIAMIQIAGVDLLRFWLTGTWGAFPLTT